MIFKTLKASEYCDSVRDGTHDSPKKVEKGYKLITSKNIKEYGLDLDNASEISEMDYKKVNERSLVEKNDILYSMIGTIGLIHRVNYEPKYAIKNMGLFKIKDEQKSKWLYYYLKTPKMKNYINSLLAGSTQQYITLNNLRELPIQIPENDQDTIKIIYILELLDNKIAYNMHTNNNLEKQLQYIFYTTFFRDIENNDTGKFKEKTLYDVLDVIDNRGKTPKLVEYSEYPIIDVRAISGEGRIIDYKNCQKYVDLETYNTFFRNGHPQKNDILISTVGSLAELKIYIDNKGTIAQNVVALRSKDKYYLYYYQYLKAIKNDLISYNIGSVQPSIKVTQFMKHNIYIPEHETLEQFNNKAEIITNKIYYLSKEIETLEQIRDTLLPKLMNGEIDLDKIEI